MKAITVDEPHISRILQGLKTWEMRKRPWKFTGKIGLIRKGSGEVVGTAIMTGCKPPLRTKAAYAEAEKFHCIEPGEQDQTIANGWIVPWALSEVRRLSPNVKYKHPPGAVIQVELSAEVTAEIEAQMR